MSKDINKKGTKKLSKKEEEEMQVITRISDLEQIKKDMRKLVYNFNRMQDDNLPRVDQNDARKAIQKMISDKYSDK